MTYKLAGRGGVSRLLILLMVLLVVVVAGCGKQDNATTDGGTASQSVAFLELTSDTDTVGVNGVGSATFTVRALDAANVLIEGVAIDLSATMGALSLGSAVTDAAGAVTFTFDSGSVSDNQIAEITARYGSLSVTKTIEISVAAGGPQLILLTSDKDSVNADGSDVAQLNVRVLDANNAAVAGAQVSLSATLGALSAGMVTTDDTGTKLPPLQHP
jgi:hypothetical protein